MSVYIYSMCWTLSKYIPQCIRYHNIMFYWQRKECARPKNWRSFLIFPLYTTWLIAKCIIFTLAIL